MGATDSTLGCVGPVPTASASTAEHTTYLAVHAAGRLRLSAHRKMSLIIPLFNPDLCHAFPPPKHQQENLSMRHSKIRDSFEK